MSQSTTLILLPQATYSAGVNNSNPYTVTGTSQPAAAYYIANRDLQTVNINLTGVTGNVVIEATLASSPGATDWFKVYELAANNTANVNNNATLYTNIDGNFVYMRAKVVDFAEGIVNFVKLSY